MRIILCDWGTQISRELFIPWNDQQKLYCIITKVKDICLRIKVTGFPVLTRSVQYEEPDWIGLTGITVGMKIYRADDATRYAFVVGYAVLQKRMPIQIERE